MKRIAVGVVALVALCCRAWAAAPEVTGDELVANGSFESDGAGWTMSSAWVKTYANNAIWVSPSLVRAEGAGDKFGIMQAYQTTTAGSISQTLTLPSPGVYRLTFVFAARSVSGTSHAGATTKVTVDDRLVTSFTTENRHTTEEESVVAYFYVSAAGSHTLKFQTFHSGDRSNIIDLVSVRKVAQDGLAIVTGVPGEYANAGGLPQYGMLYPQAGNVLSAPASIDISRTETADLIGYDLCTGETSVDETTFVAASSYAVTAADAASLVRLAWKWRVRERTYPLDASLFSRKCTLTVCGYAGESTLTNFPVLVKLSEDIVNFSYGDMALDGGDLRFYDAKGNFVAHDVDVWNTSGESLLWVRVPELPKGGTTLTLYYGSTDLDKLPPLVGADVWQDYVNVWHMNVASDWSVAESTSDARHGTVMNTSGSALGASGMIGGAFSNGDSAYVIVDASDRRKAMTPPYTFSAWVYNNGNGGNNADIWNDKNNGAGCGTQDGVEIGLEGGVRTLIMRGSSNNIVYKDLPTFSQVWRHLLVVYDAGKSYVYMDGVAVTNGAVSLPSFAATGKLSLGQRVGAGPCKWQGSLDEMRIRCGARLSDDWVAAEYASQTNGSDFVSYGAVERTKVAVLRIGNAGLSLDGNVATMTGQVALDDYENPASVRVTYGPGDERTSATAVQDVTAGGAVEAMLSELAWATRYTAQWEAWNQATPDEKTTADVVAFTVDGTPQVDPELTCEVVGTGVRVSADVTALRGEGAVTARLYRADGDGDETLVETRSVTAVGKVAFAAETLAWGVDYAYRAEFEHVREGVGAWTNTTDRLLVSVQDAPEKCRFGNFTRCSDIVLSGYRGKTPLRDFPVLVRLAAGHPEGFDPAKCGTNGAAIRFADQNGGLVPHEIDTWNPDGESLVWVKVPVLSGEATRIRLYFAPLKPDAALPAVNAADVWTNFFAVWHMDVAEGWGVKESARHALCGTVKSGNPGDDDKTDPSAYTYAGAAGLVGGALTNSNWAYVSVPAAEAFAGLGANITFSAWVRNIGGAENGVLWNDCNGGAGAGAVYGVEITKNGLNSLDVRGSSSVQNVPLSKSLANGWHLVTVAYTKVSDQQASIAVYVDDDEATEPLGGGMVKPLKFSSSDDLALGQRIGWTACRWIGNLDEMRICPKTESADWVKAEYDTVMNADFAAPQKVVSCRKGLVLMIR